MWSGSGQGSIARLGQVGQVESGQGGHGVRGAGHPCLAADQVDVEAGPVPGSDPCGDRDPGALHAGGDGACGRGVEAEPVLQVDRERGAQITFGLTQRGVAVDVEVQGVPGAQFARQQGRGAFEYPAVIEGIQALQDAVVGEQPLQLGERAAGALCQRAQPVGQRDPERCRIPVTGHRRTASWAEASSSQRPRSPGETSDRSSSQPSIADPSRSRPKRCASGASARASAAGWS
jgi:hypothetical protein